MTADHFEGILDAMTSRQPFQVFTLELHGGSRYEIDHPAALPYRDGIAAFNLPGGIQVWIDHDSVNQIFDCPASDVPNWPN